MKSSYLYRDIADDATRTFNLVTHVRYLILDNEGKHYTDPTVDVAGYLIDAEIDDTEENIALVRTLGD
jgi:hypothetical protein